MKKLKKTPVFFFFLLACAACLPRAVQAQIRSGSAGGGAVWEYRADTGTLEISGSGRLTRLPTSALQDISGMDVNNIVIGEGITSIDGPGVFCLDKEAEDARRSVKKTGEKPVYIKSSRTLKLPKSLKQITPGAFARIGIEKVTVAPGNKYFKVKDNILYSKDGSVLVYCPRGWKGGTCRIPDGVKTISALAFARCINLKKAVLPKNLESLGPGAFFGCTDLKKINLGQARKLEAITDYDGYSRGFYMANGSTREMNDSVDRVYYEPSRIEGGGRNLNLYYMGTFEATRLSSARIPDNVRFLSEETFRDCGRLEKITFGRGFEGSINLRGEQRGKAVLLYELEALKSIKFAGGSSRFCIRDGILYSSDGKTLYHYLDKADTQRTELAIDSSVSRIAEGAFCFSYYLRSVTAAGPLEQIGDNAFAACGMETFRADGDIGRLGKGAFFHCWNLKSFLCRGKAGTADSMAFGECFKLEEARAAELPRLADDTIFEDCVAMPEKTFTLYTP